MIVILAILLGLFVLAAGHWILGGGLILLGLAVIFVAPARWDEL